MKTLLALTLVVLSLEAAAQEIGSEITPVTPPSNSGNASAGPGQAAPLPGVPLAQVELSASRMSFGIRAGFMASPNPVIISGPGTAGVSGGSAPTLGVTLFVTDNLALDFDAGLALGIAAGGATPLGFSAGGGVDWYFRGPEKAVRPFVGGKASFGKGFSTSGSDFALGFLVGGGAAYFFSPNFAVDARALVGLSMAFPAFGVDVLLWTVSPGLGATVFF